MHAFYKSKLKKFVDKIHAQFLNSFAQDTSIVRLEIHRWDKDDVRQEALRQGQDAELQVLNSKCVDWFAFRDFNGRPVSDGEITNWFIRTLAEFVEAVHSEAVSVGYPGGIHVGHERARWASLDAERKMKNVIEIIELQRDVSKLKSWFVAEAFFHQQLAGGRDQDPIPDREEQQARWDNMDLDARANEVRNIELIANGEEYISLAATILQGLPHAAVPTTRDGYGRSCRCSWQT